MMAVLMSDEEKLVMITCELCDAREEVGVDKWGDPRWSELEAVGWYFGAHDTSGVCGDCNALYGGDDEQQR